MYKILIVDDELIERKGLQKIIEKKFKETVEIQSASNGKMAIEMAKQFIPDIIFMDIKMPGMSGIDAIKEIRKDQLNVNVVIISAFDSFKYAQEAINVGAYEYLLKPVKREKIINCINRIIKFYDEEKRNQIKRELMENSNVKSINLIKENVFDYIIRNEIDKIRKIDDLNMNIINLKKGVSIIIEIPEFDNQISMYIQDYFEKNYNRHLLKIKNNYFMLFIERNNDLYKNRLRNLYKNILKKFDIEIKMVFSEYNKMEEINKVYQNNLRKVYYSKNMENKNIYPIELENKLIEKVNLNILEESIKILDDIFTWIDIN
ncbi:response regulator, partial [Clostridiaceae bacterium HSG29]|nr:response regulator [Clostridiaceae bacterium HSG29]